MGEAVCIDCRSWGEELYWTRFQCTQFCQLLSSGFDQQLPIPSTFSNNLKKNLPAVVTLKGPSGSSWKVGLTTNDGTVFFRYGWEEFVTSHSLQEKDFLIFKYYGDSNFDVLMFDGQSLCEKADSYFVRKCGHEEYNGGRLRKRKIGESSSKVALASPHDGDGGTPPVTFANNNIGESSVEVAPSSPQDGDRDTPLEKSANNHIDTSWRDAIMAEVAHKRREIKFNPVHLVLPDGDGVIQPELYANNHIRESSVEVAPSSPLDGDGDTLLEKSTNNHIDTSWRDATMGETAHDMIRKEINFTPVHLDLLEEDGGTQPEAFINNHNWESSVEVGPSSSQEGDGDTLPEKSANNHIGTSSWRDVIMGEAAHKKIKREIKFTPVHLGPRPSYKESSTCADKSEVKPDAEYAPISSNAMRGVLHMKSKRERTEKGKTDALRLAMKALSNDGFMVVMKPTHVDRKYFMSLPTGWATTHLETQAKQEIILRIDGKMWSTRYIYQKSKHSGGLSSGWRTFVVNNKLQEFDVCVFEPATPINNAVVLDVSIFRVAS